MIGNFTSGINRHIPLSVFMILVLCTFVVTIWPYKLFIFVAGITISILFFVLLNLLIKTSHKSKANTEQLINELSGSLRLRNAVFETANVGINIIDDDGNIFLANKWWTDKTGYTREEIQTLHSEILTFPDDRENSSSIKSRLFSGEITTFRFEKRFLKKDNSIFWGDSSISVVKLPPDDRIFLINIVTDITERIEAREIINQKNIELGTVVANRNRIISTLAHDLKSPFNSLLGFSDLMVENIRTYSADKIENYLRIINFTTHQTYNLFNDIIAWAKLQGGKINFNPQNLNFNYICSQTLRTLLLNAENKRILILESFKKDYWIYADQEMIKSILRNLISNSLKFTNAGGLIKISCFDSDSMNEKVPESVRNLLTSDPSYLVIAVSDTGIGINQDALLNLFSQSNEYFAIGTDNEAGTGIGLTLCKEFIAKHDGKIWAESRVGKGSVFYFAVAKGEPEKVLEN